MTENTPQTRAEARAAREIPNKIVPRADFRRYIYRILGAAGPIVVFYGLATTEEVALWLGLGATILGTPAAMLADANTPR